MYNNTYIYKVHERNHAPAPPPRLYLLNTPSPFAYGSPTGAAAAARVESGAATITAPFLQNQSLTHPTLSSLPAEYTLPFRLWQPNRRRRCRASGERRCYDYCTNSTKSITNPPHPLVSSCLIHPPLSCAAAQQVPPLPRAWRAALLRLLRQLYDRDARRSFMGGDKAWLAEPQRYIYIYNVYLYIYINIEIHR